MNPRIRSETSRFGISVALALAVIAAGHWSLAQRLEDLEAARQLVRERIALQDRKLKEINQLDRIREELLIRMQVTRALDAERYQTLTLLNILGDMARDDTRLTRVALQRPETESAPRQAGRRLLLEGRAADPAALSRLDQALRGGLHNLRSPEMMLDESQAIVEGMPDFRLTYPLATAAVAADEDVQGDKRR